MRRNLIKARKDKGWTQEKTAELLGISPRQYQRLEYGESLGTISCWDALELKFGIHQMELRKNEGSHHGKAKSQEKHEEHQENQHSGTRARARTRRTQRMRRRIRQRRRQRGQDQQGSGIAYTSRRDPRSCKADPR